MTKDPPAQVAAILEQFRPVADEMVVAVDSKVPVEEAQRFAAVADRVVRFEYAPPIERTLGWLFSLCSGRWIFRFDGDEMPSAELIRVLPDLVARDDVLQYLIPVRWVYPDSRHWLRESRWWPDFQPHLVRNDPALLRVKGHVHSSVYLTPPVRYVDAPVYHLDCVMTSLDSRRAKIERYEAMNPRTTIRSANDMYLPEDHARSRPVPIPEEDLERVARLLDPGDPPDPVPADIELVPRAAVDRYWPLRPVGDEECGGSVTCWQPDLDIRANETATVYFEVHNRGSFVWDDRPPSVQVGYRWFTGDGDLIPGDVPLSPLPCRVSPGEKAIVPVELKGPMGGGRHLLEAVLVHDGHRWFGEAARVPVDVDGNVSDDRAEWFRRRAAELEGELAATRQHAAALAQRRSVVWADRLAGLTRRVRPGDPSPPR